MIEEEAIEMDVPKEHGASGLRPFFRGIVRAATALDIWIVVYASLLCVIALLDFRVVTEWPTVLLNALFLLLAIVLVCGTRAYSSKRWLGYARIITCYLIIPVIFKTAEKISLPLHGHDFDDALIVVDRFLFGVDPTVWLTQYLPPYPWFVMLLQLSYFSFFILPFLVLHEMYKRRWVRYEREGRMSPPIGPEYDELEEAFFILVYGFCVSYLGYCLFPSVGPRFTLHNFTSLPQDLPGWWPTDLIRAILNGGENIKLAMTSDEARRVVTRDAFPSGHVMMTTLTMVLAYKFQAQKRWWIYGFGTLLIFSTVYLRYHYVIDDIGAFVLVPVTLYTWEWARAGMLKIRRWIVSIV